MRLGSKVQSHCALWSNSNASHVALEAASAYAESSIASGGTRVEDAEAPCRILSGCLRSFGGLGICLLGSRETAVAGCGYIYIWMSLESKFGVESSRIQEAFCLRGHVLRQVSSTSASRMRTQDGLAWAWDAFELDVWESSCPCAQAH